MSHTEMTKDEFQNKILGGDKHDDWESHLLNAIQRELYRNHVFLFKLLKLVGQTCTEQRHDTPDWDEDREGYREVEQVLNSNPHELI